MKFAATKMKEYYDRHHKPIVFAPDSQVYLRLEKGNGYTIPANKDVLKKLKQQYASPFRVKRRVGLLAYEIDILGAWKIHPVILVAHLEPAPKDVRAPAGPELTVDDRFPADED